MTKIGSMILTLALVALGGPVAQAQQAPAGHGHVERGQRSDSSTKHMRGARRMHGDHPRGGHAGLRGIELTDAQRTQITAIHRKYQDQFKATRDSARAERGMAPGVRQSRDTAAARAAFSRMQARRARMEQLMTQQRSEVRGVLTPAQQTTFDRNIAEMQQRRDNRGRRGARAGK